MVLKIVIYVPHANIEHRGMREDLLAIILQKVYSNYIVHIKRSMTQKRECNQKCFAEDVIIILTGL